MIEKHLIINTANFRIPIERDYFNFRDSVYTSLLVCLHERYVGNNVTRFFFDDASMRNAPYSYLDQGTVYGNLPSALMAKETLKSKMDVEVFCSISPYLLEFLQLCEKFYNKMCILCVDVQDSYRTTIKARIF